MVWWKDIDIGLKRKNNGDVGDFIDEFAVEQSIKNIFTTIAGQRRRLPNFGTDLHRLLFDPVDEITARDIGEIIHESIKTWEPRVKIQDLLIKPDPENNKYDITMVFHMEGSVSPDTHTIQETIIAS